MADFTRILDRANQWDPAAEAMRRILVERARRRLTAKRGAGPSPVELRKEDHLF